MDLAAHVLVPVAAEIVAEEGEASSLLGHDAHADRRIGQDDNPDIASVTPFPQNPTPSSSTVFRRGAQ